MPLPLSDNLPAIDLDQMGEIEGLAAVLPWDLGQARAAMRMSSQRASFMRVEGDVNVEGGVRDEL